MHTTRIRVRFDEVDTMGIVHHPRYLVYFEIARTRYMRDLGMPYADLVASGTHLAIIEAGAKYVRPARYDEEIDVVTRCVEAGRTRLTLEYEISRDGLVLATGHTRLASVNTSGRPVRMPAHVREALERELPPGAAGDRAG